VNNHPADRQRIEWDKCARNPAYWINTYAWAKDERTGELFRLELWKAQAWLLTVLLAVPLLVILKARQLGISWLVVAYGTWLITFHPRRYVLLFSYRELEAMELLDRARHIIRHLPKWMRPELAKDSELQMETARGSRIRAFPTSGSEGRTYAAALAIIDEAGLVRNLSALITALEPVTEGGGKLVVLGTAKGIGDYFTLIQMIRAGSLAAWRFVFMPWFSRPDRPANWREQQLEKSTKKWQVYQEHPETPDEAFQMGHHPRFEVDQLKGLMKRTRQPLPLRRDKDNVPADLWPVLQAGALKVWRRPRPGKWYLVASDTAEGIPERNRCTAVVMDQRAGLAVAELAGWWPDHEFAHLLAVLGQWYGIAVLAVERNNHGHAVIANLVNVEEYPGTLYRMKEPGQQRTRKRGWATTTRTRPLLFDAMEAALMDEGRRWYSAGFLGECLTCAIDESGRVGAPDIEGVYDDLLFAYMIAEVVRQEQRYLTG